MPLRRSCLACVLLTLSTLAFAAAPSALPRGISADLDAKLKALTVDEVNAAIRKRLAPDTLSVVAAGDFAKAASAPAAGQERP